MNEQDIDRMLKEQGKDPAQCRAPSVSAQTLPDPQHINLDSLGLSAKMLDLIQNGHNGQYPSRSEADAAVITALVGANCTDGEIRGIFENHRIGQKYDEKGRHGISYLATTIAKVRAYVKENAKEKETPEEHKKQVQFLGEKTHLTDLGNATRFAALHKDRVRYCHPWKSWLVWTGTHWKRDDTGQIQVLAKETVQKIYQQASQIKDDDIRRRLASHALRSESSAKIKALLELAQSEPGVPVLPNELDRHRWLFNCSNGTLELRTGHLRQHRPEDLLTNLAPVEYDTIASCPMFMSFLSQIMEENEKLIWYLQRVFGYSLTGSVREQAFFVHHGVGSNGKSTLKEIVAEVMGSYAAQTPTQTLMLKRLEGIPNDLAGLKGARLVSATESEQGRRLAESLIKQLTGGDTVSARFLHGEFFSYRPQYKIHMATNHKPIIRGADYAIWRRVRLIPYMVQIPKSEQDKELPEKLKTELPGILRWMVEGCLAWQEEGLNDPDEVLHATEGYRQEMDVIAEFLAERCAIDPAERVSASGLYKAYQEWCEENGEKPLSQRWFGERLTEKGFQRHKTKKGPWQRDGLRILSEFERG